MAFRFSPARHRTRAKEVLRIWSSWAVNGENREVTDNLKLQHVKEGRKITKEERRPRNKERSSVEEERRSRNKERRSLEEEGSLKEERPLNEKKRSLKEKESSLNIQH